MAVVADHGEPGGPNLTVCSVGGVGDIKSERIALGSLMLAPSLSRSPW